MIDIDWNGAGKAVNEAMLLKGMSSELVAYKAGIDRRTVARIRKGTKVRIQNLSAVEEVLGLEIISKQIVGQDDEKTLTAATRLGGYTLESSKHYCGNYYSFRRSYDYPEKIICAHLTIFWDFDRSCLRFRENQQNKNSEGKTFRYSFIGDIAIPLGLSCTQFIGENKQGFNRIMTCTSLRGTITAFFKGVLVGLNEIADLGYYPATTPVYIEKTDQVFDADTADPRMGSHLRSELWHETAEAELSSITDKFIAG